MRFLGKYELLEQLTVGKVETFAAYPIGGGERLLVHVFALPAMIKSAPTNRDLLGYMEAISPPAMGTLLDAGRYDDGSQAYVVTKFPRDLTALHSWVESYKALAKDKHDTTAEVVAEELWKDDSAEETKEIRPVEKPAGDFTRTFQSISPKEAPARSGSHQELHPASDIAAAPTGEFSVAQFGPVPSASSPTEQFMAALGEGSRLGGPTAPSATPPRAEPSFKPAIPSHAPLGDTWAGQSAPGPLKDPPSDDPKPGEFTMFFKSPFAPPPVSSDPFTLEEMYAPAPASRPKSEFTQLFGAAPPAGASRPMEPEPLLEPASQGAGFTNIFGKVSQPEAVPAVVPAMPEVPIPVEPSTGYVVSQNTNFPLPSLSQPPVDPAFNGSVNPANSLPGQARDENATRLFRPSVHEDAPAPPPPSSGESEYTRIISAKPTPSAPAGKPAPAAGGGGAGPISVAITPPAIPSLQPAMPHMAPLPATPVPHVQVSGPKIPAAALPKVPQFTVPAAQADKKAKKRGWTNYVPLIVILNLLLLAAVGLVLYFILQR
jgi:hypothetical protein